MPLRSLLLFALGCAGGPSKSGEQSTGKPAETQPAETQSGESAPTQTLADVVSVSATGSDGAYELLVGVRSPDTGCTLYADWWEVVSEDGALLYRRILNHSHPDEQPFERSGGPVPIQSDTVVWVRAHMAPGGYGGQALRGTVTGGFSAATPEAGFGATLETADPQPEGCAF